MSQQGLPVRSDAPWGGEILFTRYRDRFAGKLLFVQQGCRLSRQYHERKAETLMVVHGEVTVEIGNPPTKTVHLKQWNFIFIPPKEIHRIIGVANTILVEISTTELDDVIRVEDDYGRVSLEEILRNGNHTQNNPT